MPRWEEGNAPRKRGQPQKVRTTPRACTPAPSGHGHRPKERATTEAHATPKSKIYLCFCRFRSPIFPMLDKIKQINVYFCPFFALFAGNMPRWEERDSRTLELEQRNALCYIENLQQRTPPPICGAASALYPHNFPHQKYSKKSACLWEKNFGKNLRENVSG